MIYEFDLRLSMNPVSYLCGHTSYYDKMNNIKSDDTIPLNNF